MIDDSNDKTNFPFKSLLTDWQVLRLRKAFANNLSTNMKLLKTQLPKMAQLGVVLGRLLRKLLKNGLPLMKNVLKPLAKSVLVPLGSTTAEPATDAAIQKKSFVSGITTLIISNQEMEDIIKIVKSLEDCRFFDKRC